MSRARRPRAVRGRAGALGAATAALLAALVCAPWVSAPAAHAADPTDATIVLQDLAPLVPTAGSTLRLRGEVRNTSAGRMRDVQVRLRLSRSALGSRTELANVEAGQTTSRDGRAVASENLADLGQGSRASYDLSVPLDGVMSGQDFGVFVVSVEVRASVSDGFRRVGILRTFLPWVPARHDFAATGLTWLWPLQARPGREADGRYTDDQLATAMAGDGRLSRLVDAGARLAATVPLTWVVDPDLLDSAADMSASYQVHDGAGALRSGSGSAAAAAWLGSTRAATARGEVLALPYGDPDLVALRRQGLAGEIARGRAVGGEVAGRLLGRAVTTTAAWPTGGQTDAPTLAALTTAGMTDVVVDGDALPPRLDLPYTPTGRADLTTSAGVIHALLTDSRLDATLAATDDPGGPVLQIQRFLAESAIITAQLPSRSRALVVAPPRDWDMSALALRRLVDAVSAAPWLRGVPLSALAATAVPEIDRARLRYPALAQRAELPRAYLLGVRGQRARLAAFGSVLSAPDEVVPAYDLALMRLESQAWRGRGVRDVVAARLSRSLSAVAGRISVLGGSYTFGSKSGSIPLTVDNELDQAVTVQIALRTDNARLRVRSVGPVRVEARRKTQIVLPATGRANGRVLVTAQLLTPDGRPLGSPARLDVHITRYGTLALIVTGGAAALLFTLAGARTLRRVRGRARTKAAATGGGPDDSSGPGELREEHVVR